MSAPQSRDDAEMGGYTGIQSGEYGEGNTDPETERRQDEFTSDRDTPGESEPIHVQLGDRELVIRRRYEALGIVNDLLIGLWFTVGSFLFFSESTKEVGTWFFVIGSIQLLIRPAIRLSRAMHVRRRPGTRDQIRSILDALDR